MRSAPCPGPQVLTQRRRWGPVLSHAPGVDVMPGPKAETEKQRPGTWRRKSGQTPTSPSSESSDPCLPVFLKNPFLEGICFHDQDVGSLPEARGKPPPLQPPSAPLAHSLGGQERAAGPEGNLLKQFPGPGRVKGHFGQWS